MVLRRGRARFTDRCSISVDHQQLSARFIVLATGALPMRLPIDGAQHMVTSSDFLELDRLPRRIIFIGGGFISFEFAHFALRLGPRDTRCTIIEAGPRPLGPFDGEMVTTNAHVYAVVDCAATIQLARVADAEAQVAATGIVSLHCGDQDEASMA